MQNIYRLALDLHILAGLVGLVAFWTPALARKGGLVHMRAGRIFYKATCAVAITGLIMAVSLLIAPLAIRPPRTAVSPERAAAIAMRIRLSAPFLAYLLLITFGPVHHGVRVLETRRDPATLRTWFHTLVNGSMIVGAGAMIVLGLLSRQPVFVALSPIGVLAGLGNLGFARRPYPSTMAWWYEHMGAMMGGGIAFHTAFFVLGAGRLFGLQLTGLTAVVPWILPTIIGIPVSALWVRYYRRKFKEDGRVQAVAEHRSPARSTN